ncbi:hypothetical protein ABZX93_06020 [Streptomyces sp. NPDC006632]|uniref:hypothetical protein n=1 Tax=Streptomyces sp. NPDC006632 TaxID=3157182 RepID=UPI0033ADD06E
MATPQFPERSGTTPSYEVQPSLIPEHGVLISLAPINDGDFLVDLNTRGAGSGIGYLQQRDDGTYDTRLGSIHVGIATTPEAGMWAIIALHTTHKSYAPMLKGFTPSEDQIRIQHPAVSVLLPKTEEETA